MHPVEITGRRLILREFGEDDFDGTFAIVGDDRVTTWLSFDTKHEAAAAKYLHDSIARARQETRPDYYLAIVENDDSAALVGFVRLGLGGVRAADLGYAIRYDRWGRGYATEASALLVEFGFRALDLHRISAACAPDNLASQRVATKLGMQPEGRIRDHVFTNGAWRDSVTFAVLEHEWPTITL